MSVSFGSKAGLSLRTAGPALRPPTDKLGDEPALLRTEYELLIRAIDHGQHSCGRSSYTRVLKYYLYFYYALAGSR